MTMPRENANNFGTAEKTLNPDGLFNEGGKISRFANRIRGLNAVAGLHDVLQVRLDQYGGSFARNFFNVPAMIPAAVITYGGLLSHTLSNILGSASHPNASKNHVINAHRYRQ